MSNDNVIQAHGMTRAQMQALRFKQIEGNIDKVPANNAGEKILDKHFKEEYSDHQIPDYEQHLYHIVTEDRAFDQKSGARLSFSVVHKMSQKTFEFMKNHHGFAGKTTHILHNPTLKAVKVEAPTPPIEPTKEELPPVDVIGNAGNSEVPSENSALEDTFEEPETPKQNRKKK